MQSSKATRPTMEPKKPEITRGVQPGDVGASQLRKWLAPIALFATALALRYIAGLGPEAVEQYYSRAVYLHLGRALSVINRYFPFSLGEALIIILPIAGLPFTLHIALGRLRRGERQVEIFLGGVRALLWLAGGGFMLFLLLWGFNYHRPPLGAGLSFTSREPDTAELEMIARRLIGEANSNYDRARGGRDWTERSISPIDRNETIRLLESAFRQEPLLGESARGGFGPPKPVMLSRAMTLIGLSGLFSPFTGEPNYNAEQPDCDLPYTIAHEMAHQRGYAREDEANFIAFLVCRRAAHPYLRYSGYLRSLRVLAALRPRIAPERYGEIVSALGAGPLADAQASAGFWQRGRSPRLSRMAERTNDAYLQANRVQSGIRNYGEVTALIIAFYLTYPADDAQ